MSCFDIRKKLKNNIMLTENEKNHVKGCEKCHVVMDEILETKLKKTGRYIKKRTGKRSSQIKTEDIMENIGISVGKKIRFLNDNLLIVIISFSLMFTFVAYLYSDKSAEETETVESETLELISRSGDVNIESYYDDVKGQKGYSIQTEKESLCSVRGRYVAELGPDSDMKLTFSSVTLNSGQVSLSVKNSSEFVRVNCDDLFFFNTKSANIRLTRRQQEAELTVEEGVAECYINNRFVLLSTGDKIIIGNDRRFRRVDR